MDHDPSGVSFNVPAMTRLEDGRIVTQESVRRREARLAQSEEGDQDGAGTGASGTERSKLNDRKLSPDLPIKPGMSKRQQKRLALYAPRPVPPKPVIPEEIALPAGEENWLALWDLPDEDIERRLLREKRRKAGERKALRLKQQSGKAERRAARDEKRRVYRDIKLEWKAIKGSDLRLFPRFPESRANKWSRRYEAEEKTIQGHGR